MTVEMQAQRELPRYKCHKEVRALKIAEIKQNWENTPWSGPVTDKPCVFLGATITPAEDGYAPFDVSWQYFNKHQPQVGGYFVVYSDGYQSYSPAAAFEEDYTRIS